MIKKTRRHFELAISFWIGIGLMSIINIWKITANQNALNYSRIMLGISIIFIIICALFLVKRNVAKRE